MSIPTELTTRPNWVLHQNKVPYQVNGAPAKSNDPTTWTTFDNVVAAVGAFDGIGFELGDGIAGVDLDKCYDEAGKLDPRAAEIVQRLNSYTERSPSGLGLHILVQATATRAVKTPGVEIYPDKRYFTVTGDHVDGTPETVESRQAELDALVAELTPATVVSKVQATVAAVDGDEHLFSAWANKAAADVVEGNRNSQLFKIAAEGCGRGLPFGFVQSVCLQHCNGLTVAEVERTVRSAFSKERTPNPPAPRTTPATVAADAPDVSAQPDDDETAPDFTKGKRGDGHRYLDRRKKKRQELGFSDELNFEKTCCDAFRAKLSAHTVAFVYGRVGDCSYDETEERAAEVFKALAKAATVEPPPPPPPPEPAPQAVPESRPQSLSVKDLLAYNVEDGADCLLGKRYLCRGQGLLLPGPTGIGKSSLVIQMALCWSLGRDCFGITPARPLRSLILQAENDVGDLSEMVRGVVNGLDLPASKIKDMVTVISETSVCGAAFHPWARQLILRYRPDIAILDPLFAFIGGNASDQGVVSPWLRNGLGTVSQETGAAWLLVHHVKKPSELEFERKASDYSYSGFGSVEFANVCRGVLALRDVGSGRYELRAAKRGTRAGLVDSQGQPTDTVFLRHARAGICWERADEPEDERVSGEEADAQEVFEHMEPGTDYNTNALIQLACDVLKLTRGNFTNPAKRGARVLRIVKERTKKPGQNWLFLKTSKDTTLFPGGIH